LEKDRIQKFLDLILNEHYCEDCNELCSTGEAFPLEFVAKYIIKIKKENENLKQAAIINKNLYKEVCNKNKELEEENKKLNNANKTYINAIQNITPVLMADYVEKSLIKEKIEELNKMLKKSHKKPQRLTVGEIMMIKTVLQELLRRIGEARCLYIKMEKQVLY